MVFYAVVSDEIEQVIEFFARVPVDEPDWRDTLHVEHAERVLEALPG